MLPGPRMAAKKMTIYLLCGQRPNFGFAASVVFVLAREPMSSKAARLNHARRTWRSEYVAILTAPRARLFLQMTWLVIKTRSWEVAEPHPSPRRKLSAFGRFRRTPKRARCSTGGTDGNAFLGYTSLRFCACCAVVPGGRGELPLRPSRRMPNLATPHGKDIPRIYRIPQPPGWRRRACRRIGQRMTGAREVVRFPLDNPLLGKGLKLVQRLCTPSLRTSVGHPG